MVCPEVARPASTINRIMKRLSLNLLVTAVPRPKEEPYWYMPNPAIINAQSSKVHHFLGLADIFLQLGQPEIFVVEPEVTEEYRPDAYTIINGTPVVIEYQRSKVATKVMQQKVDNFRKTFKQHKAKTLWICSDIKYNVKVPEGFTVIQGQSYMD